MFCFEEVKEEEDRRCKRVKWRVLRKAAVFSERREGEGEQSGAPPPSFLPPFPVVPPRECGQHTQTKVPRDLSPLLSLSLFSPVLASSIIYLFLLFFISFSSPSITFIRFVFVFLSPLFILYHLFFSFFPSYGVFYFFYSCCITLTIIYCKF